MHQYDGSLNEKLTKKGTLKSTRTSDMGYKKDLKVFDAQLSSKVDHAVIVKKLSEIKWCLILSKINCVFIYTGYSHDCSVVREHLFVRKCAHLHSCILIMKSS